MPEGEAIKLKVPKETYENTLKDLDNVLSRIQDAQTTLGGSIGRMEGETFSGTDVQSTIDLAQDILKRLDIAYKKFLLQRGTLQDYLDQTRTEASTLQSSVSSTSGKLPNIFESL